jgi:hypothetical protein
VTLRTMVFPVGREPDRDVEASTRARRGEGVEADRAGDPRAAVLRLQRTAGNRAVVRLLRQAAAVQPSNAWDELYYEIGALELALVKLNATAPVVGERTDLTSRLQEIMGELGDPAATSEVDLARVRAEFEAFKAGLETDRVAVTRWWASLTAQYEEEDARLAKSSEPSDKRAREILAQSYATAKRRLDTTGAYARSYDVMSFADLLFGRKHVEKALDEEIQKELDTVFDEPPAGAAGGRELEEVGALRKAYAEGVNAIGEEAKLMVSRGVEKADVAKWANDARNALKVKIRNQGARIVKVMAEARNIRKYGNPVGKTYEQLRAEGKTDEEIIESAARGSAKITRWAGRLRIAGRILIAIDIGIGVWNVATASVEDRPRVLLHEAGRIGGGLAGAYGGAKVGGVIGGEIGGPWGAGIGAVVGGIGGLIFGSKAGAKLGDFVANTFYPPAQTKFEGDFQ